MTTLFDYYMTARATTGPQGYTGSNRADAPAVNGWTAVKVDKFFATSADFAAQAYTDGQGHFRISIRPSQTVGDWTSTNVAIGTGQWHPEFTDAIRFYGELILQIKETPDGSKLSLDAIRAQIDGSAFSQGAGLLQAASKFWGTKGVGWDGPGAAAQMGNQPEIAKLQQEFRAKGLTELQDNYEFKPGDFQMRQYTYVGGLTSNIKGVEVYTDPHWKNLSDAADAVGWMAYMPTILKPEFIVRGDDGIVYMKAFQTYRAHSMDVIGKMEGFATPDATAAQLLVQQNLAKGLSASGYAEGSHQYEALGGSGMAFAVTVYRNGAGQLVEVRVPGQWVGGSFQALGAPISSVASADGKVHALGISDPVDSTPEMVITASRIADPVAGRNSANLVSMTGVHTAKLAVGSDESTTGYLSDLWVVQMNAANGFADAKEFYAAVLASNPGITDVNKISAGQTIYLPEQLPRRQRRRHEIFTPISCPRHSRSRHSWCS